MTETPIPQDARDMHERIYSHEEIQLPPVLIFLMSTIFKSTQNQELKANEVSQTLLLELEHQMQIVNEAIEEQTIARTLLVRFGAPYLEGAEAVWLTLSEYLTQAKEATDQAKLELQQTINQMQAILINQFVTEEEAELKMLEAEEEKQQQGVDTLKRTDDLLVGENQLISQSSIAVIRKKETLNLIVERKKRIKDSIAATQASVSNLISSFIGINRFNSTELVMA